MDKRLGKKLRHSLTFDVHNPDKAGRSRSSGCPAALRRNGALPLYARKSILNCAPLIAIGVIRPPVHAVGNTVAIMVAITYIATIAITTVTAGVTIRTVIDDAARQENAGRNQYECKFFHITSWIFLDLDTAPIHEAVTIDSLCLHMQCGTALDRVMFARAHSGRRFPAPQPIYI